MCLRLFCVFTLRKKVVRYPFHNYAPQYSIMNIEVAEMNPQTILDKFLSLTPRAKLIIAAIVLLILTGVPLAAYFAGKSAAQAEADSKYLRERDKNLQKIAEYETRAAQFVLNERQLAAENALLKKTNEAQAEILLANDKKLAGDADKFTELVLERNQRIADIDADSEFDSQVCGLCDDAKKSGFSLSKEFCARCEVKNK